MAGKLDAAVLMPDSGRKLNECAAATRSAVTSRLDGCHLSVTVH
jgi:hypothetical protein